MKKHYPLDPDNPDATKAVESALLQGLDPLPPSPAQRTDLRTRIFQRIHTSVDTEAERITIRSEQGSWRTLSPGVRAKTLDAVHRTFILDLAPGASLPMHRHHENEECIVLRGSASLGTLTVNAGDYHLARSGSRHGRISSASGAMLYLRGIPVGHTAEIARDLLTALLPGEGQELLTIPSQTGEWIEMSPGVSNKPLFDYVQSRSTLIRLNAGTSWSTAQACLSQDEECLILEGDAFIGDTLLRHGDWQIAPVGAKTLPIASDHGALLFVRSGLDRIAAK